MVVEDGGRKLNVAFMPSVGRNEGVHVFNYPNYPNIADDLQKTFRVLKTLPCDVFLGPHGRFFDLEGKFKRVQAGAKENPFIDPAGCRQYVERGEAAPEAIGGRAADQKMNAIAAPGEAEPNHPSSVSRFTNPEVATPRNSLLLSSILQSRLHARLRKVGIGFDTKLLLDLRAHIGFSGTRAAGHPSGTSSPWRSSPASTMKRRSTAAIGFSDGEEV